MYLSEDHRAVQDAVRAFVRDRIAPQAAAWDRDCHFPREELKGLAELGCYGIAVPTEWDGAGLDCAIHGTIVRLNRNVAASVGSDIDLEALVQHIEGREHHARLGP